MPDAVVTEGIRPAVPEQSNKGPEQPKGSPVDNARKAGKQLFDSVRRTQDIPKTVQAVATGNAFNEQPAITEPASVTTSPVPEKTDEQPTPESAATDDQAESSQTTTPEDVTPKPKEAEAKTSEQDRFLKMAEIGQTIADKIADGTMTAEQGQELIDQLAADPEMIDSIHQITKLAPDIDDTTVDVTSAEDTAADLETQATNAEAEALDPDASEEDKNNADERAGWLKSLLMALKMGLITAAAAIALATAGSVSSANMAGSSSRQ